MGRAALETVRSWNGWGRYTSQVLNTYREGCLIAMRVSQFHDRRCGGDSQLTALVAVERPVITSVTPSAYAQRPRLVARQAIVGFGWTTAALAVGFATKMLLTRTMAAADLGVVLAAQAFAGLMLVVAELGVPDAVVRYVGPKRLADAAPGRTVQTAIGSFRCRLC